MKPTSMILSTQRSGLMKSRAAEELAFYMSETKKLSMGAKLTDLCGPVLHKAAFDRIGKFIEEARADSNTETIEGGDLDDAVGWYIVSSTRSWLLSEHLLTMSATNDTEDDRSQIGVPEGRDFWSSYHPLCLRGQRMGIGAFPAHRRNITVRTQRRRFFERPERYH